ncbi:MAG: hypothetical protein IJA35_07035 [Clostridia bacterium]|nr:hypothetical protein [Clostridia bacterium]
MDWLNEYVIRLCAISIAICISKLVLPGGALKQTAQKALSLVLLYAASEPLLKLLIL